MPESMFYYQMGFKQGYNQATSDITANKGDAESHPRQASVVEEDKDLKHKEKLVKFIEEDKPCPKCGKVRFPKWDETGRCIKCARDEILGAKPSVVCETCKSEIDKWNSDDGTCPSCKGSGVQP